MALLAHYLRPATVAEAVEILRTHGARARILAGGTQLLPDLAQRTDPEVDVVVDIGRLGLASVRAATGVLRIGACATLTDLLRNETAFALADGLLVKAAHGEGPVNLRNALTLGGLVARADTDSEVFGALLALGATVTTTAGDAPQPLAALSRIEGIITEVQIPLVGQQGALARVARTPADRPIVAALAVRDAAGVRVALCGLGTRPVLSGAPFDPFADFKGSAVYRAAMAQLLAERALAQLG